MVKRTYQPKKTRKKRKLGFLKKMETSDGQKTIQRRRRKGRTRLTA